MLSATRLTDRLLVLHELAHLIAAEGHTDKWRRVFLSLGGTLDAWGNGVSREMHKRTRELKDRDRPHLGYKHHPACPCLTAGTPC